MESTPKMSANDLEPESRARTRDQYGFHLLPPDVVRMDATRPSNAAPPQRA
jgi:hypothetical protein